ncbi:MAG: hypothetical protein ACJ74M_02135 [Gaiellaceae bacterium]|jgi:hypothetical protein
MLLSVGKLGGFSIRGATHLQCGFLRMPCSALGGNPSNMHHSTYAVWWQESGGPRHAGKLQLGRLHLLLSGNASARLAVPLEEVVSVNYRRGELHIERRGFSELRIGNLDGPGVLLELSNALAA